MMKRYRRKMAAFLSSMILAASTILLCVSEKANAAYTVDASYTAAAISVDSSLDAAWSGKVKQLISKVSLGTVSSSSNLSGNFGILWDNTNVYVMADIMDDTVQNDSNTVSGSGGSATNFQKGSIHLNNNVGF